MTWQQGSVSRVTGRIRDTCGRAYVCAEIEYGYGVYCFKGD
ncbi:hypothetical protein [Oribacterium sp. WCC10]|nr:hypothetical protein [Oribacterium sp. WCC10]